MFLFLVCKILYLVLLTFKAILLVQNHTEILFVSLLASTIKVLKFLFEFRQQVLSVINSVKSLASLDKSFMKQG
jgi:hypothetical protein